jgi:hypothetical protein
MEVQNQKGPLSMLVKNIGLISYSLNIEEIVNFFNENTYNLRNYVSYTVNKVLKIMT